MASAGKTLTVSYGTFSCTLEGFDDSVETMKVIAEYFRDLVADDRYFGAEPPTLDADMLARLAKADAKAEDIGQVVRLNEHVAERADFSDAESFFGGSDNDAAHVYDDDPGATSATSPVDAVLLPDYATEPGDAADEDSLSARLQRLRSVARDSDVDFIHDETEPDTPQTTRAEEVAELNALLSEDQDEPVDEADVKLSANTPEDEEPVAQEVETNPVPEDRSPIPWDDTALDDEEALIASDPEATDGVPPDAAKAAFDLSPEDEEELQRALVASRASPREIPKEVPGEISDTTQNVGEDYVSDERSENTILAPDVGHPVVGASENQTLQAERDIAPSNAASVTRDVSEALDVPSTEEAQQAADPDTPELDPVERVQETSADQEPVPAGGKLRRGLARLLGAGKRPDEEEERIFDEADHKMDDQDVNMRRTAIQHLRAAVAATHAEGKAGSAFDQSTDDRLYQADLAHEVPPPRPDAAPSSASRLQRPREQRTPPLKLVAEQRVDLDHAPISPRRVITADLMPATLPDAVSSGFKEFAEARGVTGLSDLLEAAAAYMSDVEGLEEFSRPMLMNKLKEVQHAPYSREDSLRSFGKLLSAGKLRKLKGGRFAVTDETDYRDDARNVG